MEVKWSRGLVLNDPGGEGARNSIDSSHFGVLVHVTPSSNATHSAHVGFILPPFGLNFQCRRDSFCLRLGSIPIDFGFILLVFGLHIQSIPVGMSFTHHILLTHHVPFSPQMSFTNRKAMR